MTLRFCMQALFLTSMDWLCSTLCHHYTTTLSVCTKVQITNSCCLCVSMVVVYYVY